MAIEYRLERGPIDRLPSASSRSGSTSGRGDCCDDGSCGACRQGGNCNYSGRLRDGRRPDPAWPRGEPEPAGRQHHRRGQSELGDNAEAAGTAPGSRTRGERCWASHQSSQSRLAEPTVRVSQAAARTLGLNLHVLNASSEGNDKLLASLMQLRRGQLVIGHRRVTARSRQLAALLSPASRGADDPPKSQLVAAGGLVSYGGVTSNATA